MPSILVLNTLLNIGLIAKLRVGRGIQQCTMQGFAGYSCCSGCKVQGLGCLNGSVKIKLTSRHLTMSCIVSKCAHPQSVAALPAFFPGTIFRGKTGVLFRRIGSPPPTAVFRVFRQPLHSPPNSYKSPASRRMPEPRGCHAHPHMKPLKSTYIIYFITVEE